MEVTGKDFALDGERSRFGCVEFDEQAVEMAERIGFDLSLIASNLELSYEERLLRHDEALAFAQALREAGRALHAQASPVVTAAR